MAKFTKIIFLFIFVVFLFAITKCANQLPPGGGEKDTTPPQVLEVYPKDGTTNFSDDYLEIKFSEYVDKRSAQAAVFISPAVRGKLDYSWSGKSMEISLTDTSLKKNKTYSISIGSGVKDVNNGNNMAVSFNFAFATGDSIDVGQIYGKVYDEKTSGVMIFAYSLNDTSFSPLKSKPDYISQVSENGVYRVPGIATGSYRVFAIRDKFQDLIYNPETDEYGAPFADVSLTATNPVFRNLDFQLVYEDTSKPHIYDAKMIDLNHVKFQFSEFIDSSRIGSNNFSVYDSTGDIAFPVKYFYKGKGKEKEYFAAISDTVNSENEIYLIADSISDMRGNLLDFESTKLSVVSMKDTIPPSMFRGVGQYPGNFVDYDKPELTMFFTDGFDTAAVKNSFELIDKSEKQIPIKLDFTDDATVKLISEKKLKPKNQFQVKINLKNFIDAAGNSVDSIYTYKFDTINDLDFSGVSGKVKQPGGEIPVTVILQNAADKTKYYSQKINAEGLFNFNKVIPDKYLLWTYIDSDSSGNYSYGQIKPFEYSEKFVFYPDTLKLIPRWPVGDIIINFDK